MTGWTPGRSTDFVALALARDFGLKEVIFAGKPAFVYNYVYTPFRPLPPSVWPFRELTWSAYRRLIPKQWSPGAHAPVDPTASRFAVKEGMAAIVIDGKNIKNFDHLLQGKTFQGTIIK